MKKITNILLGLLLVLSLSGCTEKIPDITGEYDFAGAKICFAKDGTLLAISDTDVGIGTYVQKEKTIEFLTKTPKELGNKDITIESTIYEYNINSRGELYLNIDGQLITLPKIGEGQENYSSTPLQKMPSFPEELIITESITGIYTPGVVTYRFKTDGTLICYYGDEEFNGNYQIRDGAVYIDRENENPMTYIFEYHDGFIDFGGDIFYIVK